MNDEGLACVVTVEAGFFGLFPTPATDSFPLGLLGNDKKQTRGYPLVNYHAQPFGHARWASVVVPQDNDRG